jgi:hypothetical protein
MVESGLYLLGRLLLGLFLSSVLAGLGYVFVTFMTIALGYTGPVAVRVVVYAGPVAGAALGASWSLFMGHLSGMRRFVFFCLTLLAAFLGAWVSLRVAGTIPRHAAQWGTPALAGIVLGAAFAANIPPVALDVWRAARNKLL